MSRSGVPEGVDLWVQDLDLPVDTSVLDEGEEARALAISDPERRRRWRSGRAGMRHVLGRYGGLPPRALRLGREPGGRPTVSGLPARVDFSRSEAGRWSVVAVSRRRVGVDVEDVGAGAYRDGLADWLFTPSEVEWMRAVAPADRSRRLLRLWTARESVTKALGTGLRTDPRRLRVEPGPPLSLVGPPPGTDTVEWHLVEVDPGHGLVGTVAVWGGRRPLPVGIRHLAG
ncbi:MAG: 4'-phosphopantetheinyl transferase family protein [Actinomycetota bacterium]